AALSRVDRGRVEGPRRTLAALMAERTALQARARELARLEGDARRASAAVEAAVAARGALVKEIDARRDLNAQLAGELQDAQRKLQSTIAQMTAGRGGPGGAAPVPPFRGAPPPPSPGAGAA